MKDPTARPASSRPEAADILVVDDSRLNALKLSKAMQALGHRAEMATDGQAALDLLRRRDFDLVLLDIVMPAMDGYQVLEKLKADAQLRELPVIVISSLEDEVGSVARALELGAEDFLPKDFEPAILKARLESCLGRKRLRDREIAYLQNVEELTRAACIIEAGAFRPADLQLGSVLARRDSLGRLAAVFLRLSEVVYERERRLDQTQRTLRGAILVVLAGALFALQPSLSRIGLDLGATPLGLATWQNVVGAVVCLVIGVLRGGVPRLRLVHLRFLVAWALVLGCLYRGALVVIAEQVDASMIALISSSRGFIVFALAALIALERPSLRRLAGLGLGFAAVAALLLAQGTGADAGHRGWLAAALVLPALLAVHTLLMTACPRDLDPFMVVGLMMSLSAVVLAPVAGLSGQMYPPLPAAPALSLATVAAGISFGVAVALALQLVAIAGAVFAGQMAYSQTLAGIAWAVLLLGEQLPIEAWGALVLVLSGFLLVEPKPAGDEFSVRIPMDRPQDR